MIADKREEELNRRMFEHMIEDFTKTFRPTDDMHLAQQFDRCLFSLVRQIYRDAQQPVLDRLTKIAMAAPMPMTFMQDKKG